MNNKKSLTLRVSTTYAGIALGALAVLSLTGVAPTVLAQIPPAEKVVHSFAPATGYGPGGLTGDSAGNLYVANDQGGSNGSCTDGCWNILKLSIPGKLSALFTFSESGVGKEGPFPVGLIRDMKGNLYGATSQGGSNHFFGSLFKISPSGSAGTLYSFQGGNDGDTPVSGPIMDPAGNLYGTTEHGGGTGCGGQGCGVIYKLTPSRGETVLYRFTGGADGQSPSASPILDPAGNLYGTALEAGDLSCSLNPGLGCGTVWKLDTSGNLSVLYSFTGGMDGALPHSGLVMDASGNLYGNASYGGNLSCGAPDGCGVVFKIDSSDNFTTLYSFSGDSSDGQYPVAALFRDSSGNLYGTTLEGGDQSLGVVFKLDASSNETILHSFAGGSTDGEGPESPLISDGKGNLYGTTQEGGVANVGVIFQVRMQ